MATSPGRLFVRPESLVVSLPRHVLCYCAFRMLQLSADQDAIGAEALTNGEVNPRQHIGNWSIITNIVNNVT
jgi:hypothetical protein